MDWIASPWIRGWKPCVLWDGIWKWGLGEVPRLEEVTRVGPFCCDWCLYRERERGHLSANTLTLELAASRAEKRHNNHWLSPPTMPTSPWCFVTVTQAGSLGTSKPLAPRHSLAHRAVPPFITQCPSQENASHLQFAHWAHQLETCLGLPSSQCSEDQVRTTWSVSVKHDRLVTSMCIL